MRKIKHSIIGFLLALIAVLAVSVAGFLIMPEASTAQAASQSDLKFYEYSDYVRVYINNRDAAGDLVIPSTYNNKPVKEMGVTHDGKHTKFLTSVTLPNSIIRVDRDAFYQSTALKSAVWSNSADVSPWAFRDCVSLTDVTIPSGVKKIDFCAFEDCTSLENITIPDSVTEFGSWVFAGCKTLKNITISKNLIKMEGKAFYGCTSLKEITLPNSLTSIGNEAFANCSGLVITYDGTKAEWDNIEKGKNAVPSSVTVICIRDVVNEIFANIEDNGVTNSSVTVTYSGYAARGYYSRNNNSTPSSAGTSFNSGTTFIVEGNYRIEVRNAYAETAVFHFTIDKTPPTGTLTGVTNGGYTNGNVSFNWTENGCTATLDGSSYTAGKTISAEGEHTIVLTDKAGNSSTYSFTIDRQAPEGTLIGVTDGGYTNGNVSFNWTENGCTTTLDGASYTAGKTISAEGEHSIVLTDKAGNSSTYTFTIDKTAPVIGSYESYTNKAFTLTAQDKYSEVAYWEYRLDAGDIQRYDGGSVTLGGSESANGVWNVRAIDICGNASNWITVNHVYRESFGNSDNIRNSYFIPAYYVVTLSQKYYTNCYGSYTFSDYSSALSFTTAKEWECRVIILDGGSSWNYVTATNENTRQIYTDITELNSVIDKYARKNIGDRKVMGKNGAVLNNPTDADGVTRPDALTEQIVELPQLLSDYSSMQFMLAQFGYSFAVPKNYIDGNKSTATIQFISDGISLREDVTKPLEYGVQLKDFITEQGWYLITESDLCGNVEQYLIYIDLQQPELYADVAYGDARKETIDFNQNFIDSNTGAMRYVEFAVRSLSDNMDNFVMISIDGRNISEAFVWGDELPVLSYENGYYGAYTITVYDRSHNALSFVVYIAGAEPSLKNTSLTSETACTFTIQINDSYNEITDVKFFKILFDGTEERIWTDSYDTEVCAQNLVYKMSVGGKYVFEFTDLYGRTVRTNPIFYMNGLPSATLRGVKDGGLTKNDVSILYDTNATLELFIYRDGQWVNAELYEFSQGIAGNTVSITAGADTTAMYKALLYVTADRNLFTEYTFEIDGILPFVELKTENGDVAVPGTVTTQSFCVTWSESGYTAYYRKQGAISDMKYVRDTYITAPGTYVFTFYDAARNELTISMTLDNVVSYTLDGNYIMLDDGSYITRSSFTFTMSEPWSVFDVETSNGLTMVNGQKLDTDGVYRISVKDMYGNALALTLIIDKMPPVPVIKTGDGETLSAGAKTTKSFYVVCEEEGVNVSFVAGAGNYIAYDGSLIDDAGTYSFRLTDIVGNVATITITIDREIKYRVDGTYVVRDDIYHSRLWLQVIALEETSIFEVVSEDGTLIDTTKRITVEGLYYVVISDIAGNSAELTLLIDKTAPTARFETESGQALNDGATTNEPFRIICEEQDSKITYSFNGGASVKYADELLSESGTYVFTVTDFLGTSAELRINVDTGVKLTVNGTYVIDDAGKYISKNWLSVTLGEDMQSFYIQAQDGSTLEADSRITAEGEYTVYAKDESGNERELVLVIDKTAPIITLDGVTENGATNELVTVKFKDYSLIYYRYNNGDKIATYDGVRFDAEGSYNIIALDLVGNSVNVSFVIDKHVDVTPSIAFVDDQFITGAVSFTFGESVTATLNHDGNENLYTRGEIVALGDYALTVTDEVGNVKTFNWSILPEKARNYSINVPDGFTVSIELNGQVVDAVIDGDMLSLTENGNYKLSFVNANSNWQLELCVDNVAPSVQFENTRKSVIISQPNKENMTYTLYYNGAQTTFNLKNSVELTKVGNYRLVCVDEVGNITEYIFELNYLSDISIALICVVSALVVVGIVTLVVFRFKRKIY